MDLEKLLLRKVGEAVGRFKMIRDGDRVAVALSGGKDSLTLLEALLLLAKRAPIEFSVCAFTVEQGKFLRPIEPLGEYLKARGVDWTYHTDNPSLRLARRAARSWLRPLQPLPAPRRLSRLPAGLGANVIAFGHTADDFCESFLRNAMFTGRVSALPPITYSREKDFRLIRPLAFVTEDITSPLRRIAGRAHHSVRLFAADRHGAQVDPGPVQRNRKGLSAFERDAALGHGQSGTEPFAGSALSGSGRGRQPELLPILED